MPYPPPPHRLHELLDPGQLAALLEALRDRPPGDLDPAVAASCDNAIRALRAIRACDIAIRRRGDGEFQISEGGRHRTIGPLSNASARPWEAIWAAARRRQYPEHPRPLVHVLAPDVTHPEHTIRGALARAADNVEPWAPRLAAAMRSPNLCIRRSGIVEYVGVVDIATD